MDASNLLDEVRSTFLNINTKGRSSNLPAVRPVGFDLEVRRRQDPLDFLRRQLRAEQSADLLFLEPCDLRGQWGGIVIGHPLQNGAARMALHELRGSKCSRFDHLGMDAAAEASARLAEEI